MKFFGITSLLVAAVAAAPTEMLEARQAYTSISELENGACRPLILIFARGSTQPGNIVSISPAGQCGTVSERS